MRPGLHWSLLPQMHYRLISPHIDKRLELKSLTAYLWKICVYPGKRIDYQDNPISQPEKVPDQDWVADLKIVKEGVSIGAS